jgi:hypothetical protein
MVQRSIALFLHLKGLSAKAKDVHPELGQVLASDAITCHHMLDREKVETDRCHFAK